MDHSLQSQYDAIWADAQAAFAANAPALDRGASTPDDRRRSATSLIRPTLLLLKCVAQTLAELSSLEPEQYCLPPRRAARDRPLALDRHGRPRAVFRPTAAPTAGPSTLP